MATNRFIRTACIAAGVILGATACAAIDPVRSARGDHCIDEAQRMLQAGSGAGAHITGARSFTTYNRWYLWTTSDLCPGYVVFVTSAQQKSDSCTMAAYVAAPRSLVGMWGYGACATNLPRSSAWAEPPSGG